MPPNGGVLTHIVRNPVDSTWMHRRGEIPKTHRFNPDELESCRCNELLEAGLVETYRLPTYSLSVQSFSGGAVVSRFVSSNR